MPPLNEQCRIVSKIEELFTKLDAGAESLKKVKAQLKRYRQAVLKYAFEGKLTKKWREEHKGQIEPTTLLLQRIKDEWKENLKGKRIELSPMDTSTLSKLPDNWIWARIGEISDQIQYGYTASATEEAIGPRFLRITDIQNGKINWSQVPYCKIDKKAKTKYLLKKGDLLFARTGATVGKSYLVEEIPSETIFASYLIRITLSKLVDPHFVFDYFNCYDYWRQIYEKRIL